MGKWQRRVIAMLITLSFLIVPFSSIVKADDWTETTQLDFEAGTRTNIDTITDPGNVTLRQHWQKYPTLPVLDVGPPGSWDETGIVYPMVIKDGATYKMWYTGLNSSVISPYRIGYATSPDGIVWTKSLLNPIFGLGTPSSWDDTRVYMASVIYNGTTYKMWYTGNDDSNDRIGYATSPDGVTWTRYAGNSCPGTSGDGCVLNIGSPGSWDNIGVRKPTVVYDGASYHMWYSGYDSANWRIGYATSPDGIAWTKNAANPVVDLGPLGTWDDFGIAESGAYYDGSIFHLWYSSGDAIVTRTGYATSPDGIAWTKSPANPVIDFAPAGSWDEINVHQPSVIYDNGEYRMWYAGRNATINKIGYATSPDGITWTKKPSKPVLDTGPGAWEQTDVSDPSVLYNGSAYMMWYTGQDATARDRIGFADSLDGITWNKHISNPIVDLGLAGSWDSVYVYAPTVIFNGGSYQMWFAGYNGTNVRIGYATSPNGISWNKYAGNPVFDIGNPGSWDDTFVGSPHVIFDGSIYRMWYDGSNGTGGRIGYATSPDGINWTRSVLNPIVDPGLTNSWDEAGVGAPSVVMENSGFRMWYTGSNGTNKLMTGYAASQDGLNWTKSESNPVLLLGPSGTWDSEWAVYPTVIHYGPTYGMWYTGKDAGNNRKIGFATMGYWRTGNLTSSVFDSGANGTTWNSINWTESLPSGTNITLATRSGNTPTPDASWSPWSAEMWDESGSSISSPRSRYIQYRATLITADRYATPILSDVNINYDPNSVQPPALTSPPNDLWSSNNIPTFTWTFNDAEGDSQTGFTVQIDDNSSFTSVDNTSGNITSGNSWWTPSLPIPEGIWYWRVRTRESIGLWSTYSIYWILKIDTTSPTITDLAENPDPQEVHGKVNITANITDNYSLDEVWINISGEGNFTMTFDPGSNLYFHNVSYSTLNTYSYTIWANDDSDNWNSASSSFVIHDTTPPEINNVLENPNPQEVHGNVNITANITDNYALDEVWIDISGEGNFTMTFDPNSGLYFYEASYSTLNAYSYMIWANDTSDNWASASSSFVIHDTTPPEIKNLEEDPDPQYINKNVRKSANITDNLKLDEVWINIEGIGNFSMSYDSSTSKYYYEGSYQNAGLYTYTIWANDTSGNWNSESSSFTILKSSDEKPVQDWWWIILIIVIIILIIIILFLLFRRRKKKEEEEPTSPQLPPPPPPNEPSDPQNRPPPPPP
jgi:predicted GH43/DUF377 family glycosyl hydrolase